MGAAFTVIREIRTTRDSVKGASKTLDDASKQLAELERTLDLVKAEETLQTAAVEQQARAITKLMEEMILFFDRLTIEQRKHAV